MKKILFIFLSFFLVSQPVHADLRISLTEGVFKPVPIAIAPFAGGGDAELATLGQEMTQVIVNDLEGCGLFKLVNPAAYIQSSQEVMSHPRFADWRILNAEALVGGLLRRQGAGVQIDFRLFDVFTESQLTGLSLGSDANNWRQVAHKIANAIYERLTGDPGYFDTRVTYIAESGPELKRSYRLAIMDQDGANHRFLTSGQSMVHTPRVSPDGTKIAYLDFGERNKHPHLKLHDLQTGQTMALKASQGMRMTPRFSADGSHLLLSIAERGTTCLYKMHLGSQQLEKLTSSAGAIDVSPCYCPKGERIVYNSDRGGTPQLYVKNAGSGEGTRISFGKGIYFNPIWSPRGDLICFIRKNGGTFSLGVMKPDGSGERLLDSSFLIDGPTWAPNGREIMYTSQSGPRSKMTLVCTNIEGVHKRIVNIPGEGSYPSW